MVPDAAGAPGGPAPEALRALGAAPPTCTRRATPARGRCCGARGCCPARAAAPYAPDEVGARLTEMRAAVEPAAFLAAVADARTPRPRRRRRRAPGDRAALRKDLATLKRHPAGVTGTPVNTVPAHDP